MTIVGHGIDLVEVARIARLLADHAERFRARCFTEAELAYAASGRRETEHLAARFAAKEAVLKALGTGLRHGIAWTDIEVVRDGAGRPAITLRGEAKRLSDSLGVRAWMISLTHTESHAAASAIALGA